MLKLWVGMIALALLALPSAAAQPEDESAGASGDCVNIALSETPPVEVYPSQCELPITGTDDLP